ncbi:MAG: primosomal protein N' [Gemmatimonadales bacterium]|nr:MAG: primosomal protein N' [Gemmatimonadales bacterium]
MSDRDAPPSAPILVEVAVPLPVFHPFTYRVDGFRRPVPGTRVLVPFRNGERVGWVLGPSDPAQARRLPGIRPLLDILESTPSATAELLGLARWMSEYYAAPLGLVLRSMLPAVLSDAGRDLLRRTDTPLPEGDRIPAPAARVLAAVEAAGGEGTVRGLRSRLGKGSPWPGVRWLTEAGLLEHRAEPPREPSVRTRKVVRVLEPAPDLLARETVFGRATRQRECFERIEAAGGDRDLSILTGEEGYSRSVVSGLEEKGLVEVVEEEQFRDPFDGREAPASPPDLRPTPAQAAAIGALVGALDEERPEPFLLHGITGSGKTLVYIELLREVVERRGRTAIVLVPEIALTPQTVHRFRAWFGDQVAVLHSGLSDGERYDEWRQLRDGTKRIVVGARSALFAPLPDLGAVVVDEEHDGSYKQSESPRYQGRDLAVLRAVRCGAVCVLGSATPSLESWRNVQEGKFRLLSLPDRVGGGALPPVEIVDLRTLREGAAGGGAGTGGGNGADRSGETGGGGGSTGGSGQGGSILSPRLVEAVKARLARGEQCILLLNRRGYASFVQCRACGEVEECPNCSVSLTFHRGRKRLLCHHCRHEAPVPTRCPRCGDTDLSWRGLGTEQVERVLAETFPTARLARMDVDTTGGKWAHAEILGRVGAGDVDILLGTQMIAKGLDFPNVTLVGVVNADVGLHLPDFRASERTFQLLSQVAGRAGRGPRGGEVILQTSLPEHYAIQCALTHDFEAFARRELAERKHPTYPPHLRLVNVVLSAPDADLTATAAERAVAWWRAHPLEGVEIVGPAPCPIERLHGRWRWHFFLRGGRVRAMSAGLRTFLEGVDLPAGDVRVAVDRDPVALL